MSPASETGFSSRALSPALGAEILGIDLRSRFSDEVYRAIVECWHRSQVILLRGQDLSEDDQIVFAERFGTGALSPGHIAGLQKRAGLSLITNVREDGKLIGILPDGEMQFHSDQCYKERPSKGTMLYAIDIPASGGNTLFANMYRAYETLPQDVKTRLAGAKAMNVYDYNANPTSRGAAGSGAPSYAHPMVRTHPDTGRKALYVNRLMTTHVLGTAQDESQALLDMLFDHLEKREFVYEHVWHKGDVLIWDNRCVVHARTDFDPAERRLLRRATFKGEAVA